MTAGQMLVLPERRLPELRALFEARVADVANAAADNFDSLFDVTLRRVLAAGFRDAGADEGTLWLLDEAREFLVPRYNSGPHAAEIVSRYRQSLRSGMISMVVATEQPICENAMSSNDRQDRTLDSQLGLQTAAMIAVPLYFARDVRGVLSAVQLRPVGAPQAADRGFSVESLRSLQQTAAVVSRLVEQRLYQICLGLEE